MKRLTLLLLTISFLTACTKKERHEVEFTEIMELRRCADSPISITIINSELELQPFITTNRYQLCTGNNPFPLPVDFQTQSLIAYNYSAPSCHTFDRTIYEYPEDKMIVLEIDETRDKGCTSTLFSGGGFFNFWMAVPKIEEGYTVRVREI